MKTLIVLASLTLANVAHANLTSCQSADGKVNVKASGEVLVLSDTAINAGNKTTARFTAANGTLTVNPGDEVTTYVGDVDLRFNDSNLGGRNLLGTKLGQVDTVEVTIYEADGAGEITLNKRGGGKIHADLTCE